jgi:hypothetical protein
MHENANAPLASSDRKRPHKAAWLDHPGHAELGSLPGSKRIKFDEVKPGTIDSPTKLRDRVDTAAELWKGEQENISPRLEGTGRVMDESAQYPTQTSGVAPSVNWNAGSKANIRISFGRGSATKGKMESHDTTSIREIPVGSQLGEQQVYNKSVDIMPTVRSLPSRQRLPLARDDLNQSLDLHADDHTSQISGGDQEDLRLIVVDSEQKAHVNPSSMKPISIDNDTTARIDHTRDESSENEHSSSEEESDGESVLNDENSGQESGEILESEDQSRSLVEVSQTPADANCAETGGMHSEPAAGDATMIDSNAYLTPNTTEHGDLPPAGVDVRRRAPTVLSELEPDELKLQLRYFYLTQIPDRVDPSNLVRCLVCAHEGHMAEVCSTLTCTVCGKYDQHLTKDCPHVKRCWKCRERGHQPLDCPYKVRRANQGPIVCDLCQRTGHAEDDCELIWRTSGRPWESDLTNQNIRLECYECGRPGHLGNDCASRRPGKRLGTSSWSLSSISQLFVEPEGGIMIKGRAQQQKAIVLNDSDDDKGNFFRPKVPGPIRRGQIHIASQSFSRHSTSRAPGDFDNREGRRDGEFSNSRDRGQYNLRPNDRRSISPHYAGRGSYRNSSFDQPPLPHEQPPGRTGTNPGHQASRPNRAGESYRPMSSAARGAWIRHKP